MISARRGPAYAAPAMGRMGKATMSRYDGKKVKAVFGGKGFYIALALCLAAVGAIGYFTLIRPANVTIDDPCCGPRLRRSPPPAPTPPSPTSGTTPGWLPQ